MDMRQTGKQLFMEKSGVDFLTLDEENLDVLEDVFEEEKEEEDVIMDGPLYDRQLFAQEFNEGEDDVDFD